MAGPSSRMSIDSDSESLLISDSDYGFTDDSDTNGSESIQSAGGDSEDIDAEPSDNEMEDEEYVQVFTTDHAQPLSFQFQEFVGPKHMPPSDSHPISYFNLFFTTTILTTMMRETNRNAQKTLSKRAGNLSKPLEKWKNVTIEEMKGFLACILNMGINRKPTLYCYWSTLSSQRMPWFGRMFSKHRFSHILRFFHLVNSEDLPKPGETGYDPSARYKPLLDHANNIFRHHYTPHEQLSINESFVGMKNKTSLMQYLPNKQHHRWGIKFWMLCDSVSNYCLGFYTYMGAKNQEDNAEVKENGLGYHVVMKLLRLGNYLRKGYHVFVDNFFTSITLVRVLYQLGTYLTGTVRRNRKRLPPQIKQKFSVGEKKYFRSGPTLVCAFKEKKSQRNPVVLVSSKEVAVETELTVTRGEKTRTAVKPVVINQYNKFMGGIDTSEMMLYAYLDQRQTVKYWKKVAFHIIARMVLNSFILFKENNKRAIKTSRLQFVTDIIERLEDDWLAAKDKSDVDNDDPRGPPGVKKLPARKESQCCVCSTKQKRKRSRTVCRRCSKGLHGECTIKHKC